MKHRFGIRSATAARFRAECAQRGEKPNRVFERLVLVWQLRGMPDYTNLVPNGANLYDGGVTKISCRQPIAAAVKTFAYRNRKPFYEVVEGIMWNHLDKNG